MDLSNNYSDNRDHVWWPFSSCTASIGVLENYIGKTGKRTIFNIQCRSAIDISRHSYYQAEKEYLLFPARQFKVSSLLNTGNDLHIIELEETEPPFSFFQMPPSESRLSPVPKDKSTASSSDGLINILLLGEKGVGKSTFINAFVNYLTFKTVEQAQSNEPIVLKPLSFVMTTNDTFQSRTVTFGDFDHRVTQRCQTYTFDLNQTNGKKLCLIDTPSFDDTQDFDQDNANNIKHILDYVNNLTHLNAICFLVKPDASRLLNSFQSCFRSIIESLGYQCSAQCYFLFHQCSYNIFRSRKHGLITEKDVLFMFNE